MLTHIDLFSGAGAMTLAMAKLLDGKDYDGVLCLPLTGLHVRTLGLNKQYLRYKTHFIHTSNYAKVPRCHVITAQLFDGYMQQAFRPDHIDASSVHNLIKVVECSRPNYVVIGCAPEFLDVDGGALYKYLRATMSGMSYSWWLRELENTHWLVCWKSGRDAVPMWSQTTGLPSCHSLGGLLKGVTPSIGSKFTPATAAKFAQVPPGGSLRHETYRRLSFDLPCPKLTLSSGKDALCHPTELRPLTVAEVKRVQGFPDDWQLSGTLRDQYKQLIWSVNPKAAEHVLSTIPIP